MKIVKVLFSPILSKCFPNLFICLFVFSYQKPLKIHYHSKYMSITKDRRNTHTILMGSFFFIVIGSWLHRRKKTLPFSTLYNITVISFDITSLRDNQRTFPCYIFNFLSYLWMWWKILCMDRVRDHFIATTEIWLC